MERQCVDRDAGHVEPCKRLSPPFLQLLRSILVEGQHDDLGWSEKPAMNRVNRLGDHRRSLARAGGGNKLNPIVEANHGFCLLIIELTGLDVIQKI
ncbi:hypothetical protein D3C77_498450 [compost metagenome]